MERDWTGLTALTRRICAIDLTGPVPEATAQLRHLHRQLAATVGPELARQRFDEALRRALTPAHGTHRGGSAATSASGPAGRTVAA